MKTYINFLAVLLVFIAPQVLIAQDCEACDIEVNENGFAEDLIQAGFHSALYRTSGGYAVTGNHADPNGADLLTLTNVNIANGYNYTGFSDDILFATPGDRTGNTQFVAVSSSGDIIAWGREEAVLDDALTSSYAFAQTSLSLPSGVAVSDIKEFLASTKVLVLLTKGGILYTTGRDLF
ncbi:MAG: hypothetical protein JKY22_07470 [Flavobacteriaceae bacterium]|nr:hypothetical protein [Flavobacteriaceae bacterium]